MRCLKMGIPHSHPLPISVAKRRFWVRIKRFSVYLVFQPLMNDMLHDSEGSRSKATCHVYCKKCCRKEYHFLNIRGAGYRLLCKLLTLGMIGFVGQYRCVCCGTPRIGRFDIIRGPEASKPAKSQPREGLLSRWSERRDSWKSAQRRKWWSNLFRRKSRRRKRHKPFKKRHW